MNLKNRARQLKTDLPAVFLSLKSRKTPVIAKIFAGTAIMYALSPIDLIPDFIPVLGYLDDIIILPLLIALTIKLIPTEVFAEFQNEAKDMWKDGKPKKWYYAVPFIVIWLLILFAGIRLVVSLT